jgi:hypothetical protein
VHALTRAARTAIACTPYLTPGLRCTAAIEAEVQLEARPDTSCCGSNSGSEVRIRDECDALAIRGPPRGVHRALATVEMTNGLRHAAGGGHDTKIALPVERMRPGILDGSSSPHRRARLSARSRFVPGERQPGCQARLGLVTQEHRLESVELANGTRILCELLFAHPPQRQTELVRALDLALDSDGFVRVDPTRRETSVPGVYAAGDLTTCMQAPVRDA